MNKHIRKLVAATCAVSMMLIPAASFAQTNATNCNRNESYNSTKNNCSSFNNSISWGGTQGSSCNKASKLTCWVGGSRSSDLNALKIWLEKSNSCAKDANQQSCVNEETQNPQKNDCGLQKQCGQWDDETGKDQDVNEENNETPAEQPGSENTAGEGGAQNDSENNGNNTNEEQDLSGNSSYSQQVLNLVNKERAAAGLSPLKWNDSVSKVAQAKAEDMAANNYFSHTSPTYGSPFEMMKAFGVSYSAAGENIAKGQKSPESVMNGWMNSSGHKANILNSSYTDLGVGYTVDSQGNTYWVQMFIK